MDFPKGGGKKSRQYGHASISNDSPDELAIPGYTHLDQLRGSLNLSDYTKVIRPTVFITEQPKILRPGNKLPDSLEKGAFGPCPEGLEPILELDELVVTEEVEAIEIIFDWYGKRRYHVKDHMGQLIYYVTEDSDFIERLFCKRNHRFTLHVYDKSRTEVMRMSRGFRCCAGAQGCIDKNECAGHVINIEAPLGSTIGHVVQLKSRGRPIFSVQDAEKRSEIARMRGPRCICHAECCGDIEFSVLKDGEEIAVSAKRWGGLLYRYEAAEVTSVVLTFPMNLDPTVKAILLGATFLLHFAYFKT